MPSDLKWETVSLDSVSLADTRLPTEGEHTLIQLLIKESETEFSLHTVFSQNGEREDEILGKYLSFFGITFNISQINGKLLPQIESQDYKLIGVGKVRVYQQPHRLMLTGHKSMLYPGVLIKESAYDRLHNKYKHVEFL